MRTYIHYIAILLSTTLPLIIVSCESPNPNLHRRISFINMSYNDVYVSHYHTSDTNEDDLERWRNPDYIDFFHIITGYPLEVIRSRERNDNAIGPPYVEDFGHYSYWEWAFQEETHVLFVYVIDATADDGSILKTNELTRGRIIRVYELYQEDLESLDWCITYSE